MKSRRWSLDERGNQDTDSGAEARPGLIATAMGRADWGRANDDFTVGTQW